MNKLNLVAVGFFALGVTLSNAAEPQSRPFTVQDELVRAECGDCHMTFPPVRLPMASWKKIMSGLNDHFGEDASLEASKARHIKDYHVAHAMDATGSKGAKMGIAQWAKVGLVNPLRLTATPQWKRHHRYYNYDLMAQDLGYQRGSNCIKCHKNAERGDFETFTGRYGPTERLGRHGSAKR